MTSNATLWADIIGAVRTLAGSTPLAVPGKAFTPPATGVWWELSIMPNDTDPTLSDAVIYRRGMVQINVCARMGYGEAGLHTIAETIAAALPKLTALSGSVIVSASPYTMQVITLPDRLILPVTIPYAE